MVAGVFVARWTVPMALKGTGYILQDLREKPHLIVWAILAGMLWAVANTLTVFAIRNVGLSHRLPALEHGSAQAFLGGWPRILNEGRTYRSPHAALPHRIRSNGHGAETWHPEGHPLTGAD
jgi:hypothetical protein